MLPLLDIIHLQVKHAWSTPAFDSPQVCQETSNVDLINPTWLQYGKVLIHCILYILYNVHDLKVILQKFRCLLLNSLLMLRLSSSGN